MQEEPSHRIGGAPAIVQQPGEIRVALLDHVLAEGIQQVAERLHGKGMVLNGFFQVLEQRRARSLRALDARELAPVVI